jgi:hypothetical protein
MIISGLIKPAGMLFPAGVKLAGPATGRKGDVMAKPNYQFKKRQKEMSRKKKQEDKRQRKLENKEAETEQTEAQPIPSTQEQ